jgi:hypothetical protein
MCPGMASWLLVAGGREKNAAASRSESHSCRSFSLTTELVRTSSVTCVRTRPSPSVQSPYMARDLRIEFRVDDEEKSQIVGMAKAAGYETGDWIRRMLLRPEFSQPQVIVPPPRALGKALSGSPLVAAPAGRQEAPASSVSADRSEPAPSRAPGLVATGNIPAKSYKDEDVFTGPPSLAALSASAAAGVARHQRFMCSRNCKPDWRPASPNAKCPVCSRRVVPEPE